MGDKLLIASDSRWALKIKPHTLKKLKVIEYYLNEFATSMKPTGRTGGFRGFAERNYIDLFAGPGRCVVSDKSKQTPSGMEVDGSPLIALKVKHPLSKGASPDGCQFSIEALTHRVAGVPTAKDASKRFFVGDCNEKVSEVLRKINAQNSISVAVIDSFSIACKWSTVRALARCKRMDFIINFPMGMSINRNLHHWVENESSALDDFFGNRGWRNIYEQAHGIASRCIRGFLDSYEQGLSELGYMMGNVREVPITSQKGAKLYYLIFASRSNLGDKFWNNAAQIADEFQLRMFD